MRKIIVRSVAALLLPVPFLLIFWCVDRALLVYIGRQSYPHYQPCFVWDKELHVRYRPECRSTFESDRGPISYSFNELGLRDRAVPVLSARPAGIAVLGDSVVKGLFLRQNETIPARLEEKLGADLGAPFLNAGVRFTSPTTQSHLTEKGILPLLPVRGVIWMLNGGDAVDERYLATQAKAKDDRGYITSFVDPSSDSSYRFLNAIASWNEGRSVIIDVLTRWEKFSSWRKKLQDVPSDGNTLCPGLFHLANALKERKIPLLIVFTPHYREGIEGIWMGERFEPQELQTMIQCARETGAPVLDLSAEKLERKWFFEDLIHYTPEGVDWLVGRLSDQIESVFKNDRK
jgi:hypothetical protein